jgi:radical SAM superfamily enzyme YgiQ (UPF0313 family)
MKRAGCYHTAIGIESGVPAILKGMQKGETIEQIEHAIGFLEDAGISTWGLFILGVPGETKETMRQTIRWAAKSRLRLAQFAVLDMLPGSALWNDLQGNFTPNWHKTSFMEPEWVPPGLTKRDIGNAQTWALIRFYLKPRRLIRILRMVHWSQVKYLLARLLRLGEWHETV